MKKIHLGNFETKGKVVVIDPCYDLIEGHGSKKQLNLKPGSYKAYTIQGKMKSSSFLWDSISINFRNAQLLIVHSEHKEKLNFKKAGCIDVDSGQAGFFNLELYKKDSVTPISKEGARFSFVKEGYSSAMLQVKRSKQALRQREKNDLYQRLLSGKMSGRRRTVKEVEDYFNQTIESAQFEIKEYKKILKTKKYPNYQYYELESTKNFYEIICDMTSREDDAFVNEYGTAAKTGLGDGGYDLYVAKNAKGQIIAAYIEFLELSDLKK